MAYAIPIDTRCTTGDCRRRAEFIVKNQRNEEIRKCCRRHAEALVRDLSALEDQSRG